MLANQLYSTPFSGEMILSIQAKRLYVVLLSEDGESSQKFQGRTRALNFFRVGREAGKMILVDAPGYGMRGRAEWGELWEYYVDTRPQ